MLRDQCIVAVDDKIHSDISWKMQMFLAARNVNVYLHVLTIHVWKMSFCNLQIDLNL